MTYLQKLGRTYVRTEAKTKSPSPPSEGGGQ